MNTLKNTSRGFSLVEVLAAVSIIGVIAFIFIPNIVKVKADSEENVAISRAEAINMAIASYVQASGRLAANTNWSSQPNDSSRYILAAPFLAYAPSVLADYMPTGYSIDLPDDIATLSKVTLTGPEGTISY
ncbi:MAG: type II secretion system protein [Verrucomicrobiota bacterium]